MPEFRTFDFNTEKLREPQKEPTAYSPEHQSFPWDECQFIVEDWFDSGLVQMPLASSDDEDEPTCKVVQTSAPVGMRRIVFRGVRDVEWPTVPDPTEITEDGRLKSWRIRRSYQPIGADGTSKRKTIEGEYVYILHQPADPSEGLPLVNMPILTDDGNEDEVPGDTFDEDLIS